MKITIIGAGNVGRALGQGWRDAGHEIDYALRDAGSDSAKRAEADGYAVRPLSRAADAEVTVLALPWRAVEDAIAAAGSLAGQILIDTSNALTPDRNLAFGLDTSAAEKVAELAAGARVVKAFNTTGAENMANAHDFLSTPMMPMAGDDPEAKKVVASLAEALGFEPVDAGPLASSRLLEALALFWITQAFAQNMGRAFALSVVRR